MTMQNNFIETTTRGYGSRVGGSFMGVIVGILLFLGSFYLLYWNEGRVDLSSIAKNAVSIDSNVINSNNDLQGKIVAVSGFLTTEDKIGDGLYLKEGDFIGLNRDVEMYAWVEKTKSSTNTNTGGSETTQTEYSYIKEWTNFPESGSNFRYPEGHQNPEKKLDNLFLKTEKAMIGVYSIDPNQISLRGFEDVLLDKNNTLLTEDTEIRDNYVYKKFNEDSSYENPTVGDIRISYESVNSGISGTVFGSLQGNSITPYTGKKDTVLYDFTTGDKDAGLATMHREYLTMLWLLRFLGFIMMFIGFSMILGPISVLLDFLPILGGLSRGLVGLTSFVISLILSITTILVSMILHNIIALVVAIGIIIGLIIFFVLRIKKKKQTTGVV